MTVPMIDDPDFEVAQSGSLLYDRLRVPVSGGSPVGIQGFAFDDLNKRMYTLQCFQRANGDLWLSYYNTATNPPTPSTQYMTLKNFGHGQQLGIQVIGSTTYMWLETDAVLATNGLGYGSKICRFPWAPGTTIDGHGDSTETFTKYDLQPGSLGNSANLDLSQNRLVLGFQMNGVSYRVPYNVDDIVSRGNAAPPLSRPVRPVSFPGTMQGGTLFGDYIYATTGAGKSPPCAAVNPPSSLGWQNIWTGKGGYAPNNTAPSIPIREPEGISIQTTATGVRRLVWSYSTRVDCNAPAGDPRQSWYYIAEADTAPVAPNRSSSSGTGGPLGCAQNYRIYIFDRGGQDRIGEITPVQSIRWGRVRDDISSATINTAGFGPDCCEMLEQVRSMRHELVIFRDGVRVWEGPITRVAYAYDSVEIEARDVMHYLYRRILRNGYNWSYPRYYDPYAASRPGKKHKWGAPIPWMIGEIIKDTLEPNFTPVADDVHEPPEFAGGYDPNILKYVKIYNYSDDARVSRKVYPFQKTLWEEIDDLAAHSGIDYTVQGRQIMVWDTSRAVGKTQVLTDDDFMATPVVTEYGMSLATFSAATDGKGYYGVAGGYDHYYGMVEILSSSYSETTAPDKSAVADWQGLLKLQNTYYARKHEYQHYPCLSAAEEDHLAAMYKERNTPGVKPERQKRLDAAIKPLAARKTGCSTLKTRMDNAYKKWKTEQKNKAKYEQQITAYIANLSSQAVRNLKHKNPAPVSVRIPDNSQLNPQVMLGINDIIPGIWIPLQSRSTCRNLIQWQKLDSMSVSVSADADGGVVSEQVAITVSPAPQYGEDPDADDDTPEE